MTSLDLMMKVRDALVYPDVDRCPNFMYIYDLRVQAQSALQKKKRMTTTTTTKILTARVSIAC
jgi:hypothetical protein